MADAGFAAQILESAVSSIDHEMSDGRLSQIARTTARSPSPQSSVKTSTGDIFDRFQHAYKVNLNEEEFLGLCAYLCALLRWGYRINTPDLDAFVYLYRSFSALREDFEHLQASSDVLCIPSYHQWFCDHASSFEIEQHSIITEESLRSVWKEHPFTFLRCERSLQCIASRRLQDEMFDTTST